MKKLLLITMCLFTLQLTVKAEDDKPIQVSQMPQKAQQFIKQNFASSKIAMAKMETQLMDKNYDVIFANGDKVEFERSGNWTEVDCRYSVVPTAIVPEAIRKNVAENHSDAKILKIERDSKRYEVKLSNGWELEYDMKFNLVDMDK